MALPLVVDTLDDVSEAARGAYVEKDGKFHLDVEVEDTAQLKKALNSERGITGSLSKEVKAWKALGKTPEEIQELLAEQERIKTEADKKAGNFDAILKQHQDKWAAEKAELQGQVQAATASEREAIVGERISGALAKLGATEEGIELLPDRLANRIKFETVNGKRLLKIMQADGETPMAGSGADGTATIDDLIKEASAKYPSLFKANGGGGGGKDPDTKKNPGGSGVSKKSDFKSEKERAAYVNKHGLASYNSLPD